MTIGQEESLLALPQSTIRPAVLCFHWYYVCLFLVMSSKLEAITLTFTFLHRFYIRSKSGLWRRLILISKRLILKILIF